MIKYKDYYVYIHRRKTTGEVFYVGKGKNQRAFDKHSRKLLWHRIVKKHGLIVEIIADGLQEWYALELERELIAYYGRFDLGLGSLVNFTDGGESNSGRIVSEKTRQTLSEQRSGVPMKDGTKRKISESTKGVLKPMSVRKKISATASKIMTDDRKRTLSEAAMRKSESRSARLKADNPKKDTDLYSFIKVDNSEIFIGTRSDFKEKYGFRIDKLFGKDKQQSRKGWKLLVQKETKILRFDPTIYRFYHEEHGEFVGTRLQLQKKYGIKINHLFDGRDTKHVLGWEVLGD